MDYSFKDIYSVAKSVVETDSYVIYQTIKSKLYFSGNYLLMKKEPTTVDELEYYISSCRNFFREKDVNFVHLAALENVKLSRKLKRYLKKESFSGINLYLYYLNIKDFIEQEVSEFTVEYLQKVDLNRYLSFQYKIDVESSNEEWAEHNQSLLYENIRSENIKQLVAKDGDKIVGSANIIVKNNFFEIDNLYIAPGYRNLGIAKHIITHAINNERKDNVLLVADANDTPKYMYENIGFVKISEQDFYLKTNL